jgi:hypothetical protein
VSDGTIQAVGIAVFVAGVPLLFVLARRAVRAPSPAAEPAGPASEISAERWLAATDAFQHGEPIEDPEIAAIFLRDNERAVRGVLRAWLPVWITAVVWGGLVLALGVVAGSTFLVVAGAIPLVVFLVFVVRISSFLRRTRRSLSATRRLHPAGGG